MLNLSKPVDMCIGGVLDGCVMQDGRYYRNGVEVDKDNKPVAQPKTQEKKSPAKKPDISAFVDPQVAAQLAQD